MKNYKDYLGNCYLECEENYLFAYKIIEINGAPGLECYDTQIDPSIVWAYIDNMKNDPKDFINKFIPELDNTCVAVAIPAEQFELIAKTVTELNERQEKMYKDIKNFTEEIWTGRENTKT